MKPISVEIVGAPSGYLTVFNLEDTKEILIGEPVIAWRIETYSIEESGSIYSVCIPLTVDGDVVSNCIGIQNPDMTVTVFEETTYASISELREARCLKKEVANG